MKKKITITENDIHKIVKAVCTKILEGVNTHNVLDKTFVQYGADEYDPELFRKVDNSATWLNKPFGGL
ncbi:MAG: hypothetical protein II453_02125 [Alphaproteobacteria bacterium]|nr:hypothetical protein [Alphaproteobacteria bacterium]